MNDMSAVIAAKSDQINADDLHGGPVIVTIKDVRIKPGTEQPVEIALQGTDKVFRPSKTASRVLVSIWGADASKYVGRSLHLFRDPDVTWAGVKVGGIRIDGASHIDGEKVVVTKESKKASKLQRIKPLKIEPATDDARAGAEEYVTMHLARVRGAADQDAIDAIRKRGATAVGKIQAAYPDLYQSVLRGYEERSAQVAGYGDGTLTPDNPAATEGRDTSDMGDGFDESSDQ